MCAWVRSNTWWDERPVATGLDQFFWFSIFQQTLQLATEKFQNLCNCNWWSNLLQLGSVRFWSFFFFSVQQTGPANTKSHEICGVEDDSASEKLHVLLDACILLRFGCKRSSGPCQKLQFMKIYLTQARSWASGAPIWHLGNFYYIDILSCDL